MSAARALICGPGPLPQCARRALRYGDRAVQSPLKKLAGTRGDFATAGGPWLAPAVSLRHQGSGGRDRWFDNYGADSSCPCPSRLSPPLTGNVAATRRLLPLPTKKQRVRLVPPWSRADGLGAAAVTFSGLKTNVDASIEGRQGGRHRHGGCQVRGRLPSRPPPRQRICRGCRRQHRARGSSLRPTPLGAAVAARSWLAPRKGCEGCILQRPQRHRRRGQPDQEG